MRVCRVGGRGVRNEDGQTHSAHVSVMAAGPARPARRREEGVLLFCAPESCQEMKANEVLMPGV